MDIQAVMLRAAASLNWMADTCQHLEQKAELRERAQEVIVASHFAIELALEHRNLYRAYVRVLESGRDRILDLGGSCDPVDVMERNDPALICSRKLLSRIGAANG